MRVFITGGTGLVGTRLVQMLMDRGDEAIVLSRRATARVEGAEVVLGDPTEIGPWLDTAATCDAIVNLAGEGIFNRRWTPEFKAKLRESRVKATANCADAITRIPHRADGSPKVLVNASAVGYYGPHDDEELDESSPPGDDFLASICVDWEKAAEPAAPQGARLVLARLGIVLDRHGGALSKLLTPFKLGLGGPVGSGRQFMSWVHNDDVVGMILFAIDTPALHGPLNVTAPHPVSNKQFGRALGRALGRPAIVWTPGFMLKIMLGQGAEIVVTGQNVLPKKAQLMGYVFKYPQLDAALADILK